MQLNRAVYVDAATIFESYLPDRTAGMTQQSYP